MSQQKQPCPVCQGYKMLTTGNGQGVVKCPVCDGSGVAPAAEPFFVYTVSTVPALGANASVTLSFQVKNNKFKGFFLVATSTGAFTTLISVGPKQFMNAAVHSALLYGTAQNPMPLPSPLEFNVGDTVQFQVTDLSGAPNTINIAIIGVEEIPVAS